MRVDLHIMPLTDAPEDWASHLGIVCPRYQGKATTKAPEPARLGEFAAGLLLAAVLGVRSDDALAPGVVGVDVEEVPAQYGRLQRDALRRVLSAEELAQVEASPDPAVAFALAWTRVEAVLKADGRGFAFDVRGGNLPQGWKTAHVLVAGHAVTCATREEPVSLVHRLGMGEAISLLEGEQSARER